MALSVSESNKQGIVRLVNSCNDQINNKNNRNYCTRNVKMSNDTCKTLAEIALNQSNKIITIAAEYAYHRVSSTSQLNCQKRDKRDKRKKSNKCVMRNKKMFAKIKTCDILNAISYLGLPLSPKLMLKYGMNNKDTKQELNPLFLK